MDRLRNTASDALNRLRTSRARRKLALLRLHKTGSKSFRAALRQCYPRAACSPLEYSTTVTAEGLNGMAFIAPHLSLAQWRMLPASGDWLVAVTMREPQARLRSAFRYFKGKRGSKPLQVGELLADMDYAAFLASDHPVITGLKDNVLARFLGGGLFGLETETRNQLHLPDGQTLEMARDNALAMLAGGHIFPLILEAPVQSMQRLCAALEVRRIPAIGWQNRTALPPLQTYAGDIESLEEPFLIHDRQVYAAALNRVMNS